MSTNYLLSPSSRKITRNELLSKFKCHISDDDLKEDKTVHNTDSLGVTIDSGVCWVDFDDNGVVRSLSTYSDSINGHAGYSLAESLGVEIVSEHDPLFSAYAFPVDVKTATPKYVVGSLQYFTDGEYWGAYDTEDDMYYDGIHGDTLEELNASGYELYGEPFTE